MKSTDPIASDNKERQIPVQVGSTGQNPPVTVFVVDDDPSVRQTLQLLLESAGFRAECCASAEEFQRIFDSTSPGCVVIDMGLPGMSGIALLEELQRKGVTTPVILFTGSHDAALAARAIKAGAQDYCTKSQGPTALLDSVCKAIQAGRGVPKELDHTHETSLRILELTPREREVLELLASGNGNQQVAALLGISVKTVATHRASLMRKTQSDSLATLTGRWYTYKSCR
jgi:FixJ family two-component response regulator